MENKHMQIGSLVIASALVIAMFLTSAAPVSASPDDWDWVPGTYRENVAAGSKVATTICTYTAIAEPPQQDNVISDLENKIDFVLVYGENVGGKAPITIPAENFKGDYFYIKKETFLFYDVYLWGKLRMETDGSGELALQAGLLDVDMSLVITGPDDTPPADGYTKTEYENYWLYTKMGDGTSDNAGSAYIDVEMYLDVYDREDNTGDFDYMLTLFLPMTMTTGKATVEVTDETPFPEGSEENLDGKKMWATGTPADKTTGKSTVVGATGALDVYAKLKGLINSWTDFMSVTTLEIPELVAGDP